MPRRAPRDRVVAALVVATTMAVVTVFVGTALLVHRARVDPERLVSDRAYGRVLGPPADALATRAVERVQLGLRELNDTDLAPTERLARYRAQLTAAERLLRHSLRTQPAQPQALAQLAAVRWELAPPQTPAAVAEYERLIALASQMAPSIPRVQLQLGEILLKMGRQQEAAGYFRRCIELDPATGPPIVALLDDNLVPAVTILETLPPLPNTLAAMKDLFTDEHGRARYLSALERTLQTSGPEIDFDLLLAYGTTCLRHGEPERLRRRMDELGPLPTPGAEAGRLHQRARALAARGDHSRAVDDARQAATLLPRSAALLEHLGVLLADAGSLDDAVASYRAALRQLARGGSELTVRGRLYRRIGQAHDRAGEAARAYDAYRMAVELDPTDAQARHRVHEMQRAAGVAPTPSP